MSWLLYVQGMRGPVPQKVFDGAGGKPFIDAGIKDCVLSERQLTADEDEMTLEELSARYPALTGERA